MYLGYGALNVNARLDAPAGDPTLLVVLMNTTVMIHLISRSPIIGKGFMNKV